MALLVRKVNRPDFIKNSLDSILFIPARLKSHGNLPKKRRINPFVQRNTDFIKLLCVALVKHERIQTTLERAKKIEKYGNLVRVSLYIFCFPTLNYFWAAALVILLLSVE